MSLTKPNKDGMYIGGVSFNSQNEHDEELRKHALKKGRTNFSGYVKRLIDMERLGMIGGKQLVTAVQISDPEEDTIEMDTKLIKGIT